MKRFKTIQKNASGAIEEKRSRFIADVFYVETAKEAEDRIKEIKKKYFDAKHHCYAYRITSESGIKEKQSDDGEPSGTAGGPILNVLQKNELCNVLAIVTRYFGGTLLGTGGLVRAYSEATIKALEEAGISMQTLGYIIELEIEYKDLEKLKYYCSKHDIQIITITYEKNVTCQLELKKEEKETLIEKLEINILKSTVLKEKYIRTNIE